MADIGTDRVAVQGSVRARTRLGRLMSIIAVLAGLLITNLAIYAIGRALGGTFTYKQNGISVPVDSVAVTVMSLGPLSSGLVLAALLSRVWSPAIRVARIAAPVLAVATIAVMTIPAGFDTTSAVSLAVMHLATIPAALLTLNALPDSPRRRIRQPRPR